MVFEIEGNAVVVLDVECKIYFRSVTMKIELSFVVGFALEFVLRFWYRSAGWMDALGVDVDCDYE